MKSDKKNNVIDVLADDIWRCGELIRLKENSLAFRVAKYMALIGTFRWHIIAMLVQRVIHGTRFPDILWGDLRRQLYLMSTTVLSEGKTGELGIDELVEELKNTSSRGIFILGSQQMGWFETFKQRHHHIAEYLIKQGFTVLCAMNPAHKDDITACVRRVSNGLFLVNFDCREIRNRILSSLVKNVTCPIFFHIVGTEPGTLYEDILWMKELGISLYYEYFDEISKEIFPGLTRMQIDRHNALLSDPEVLICTTAKKLYDNVIELRKSSRNLFLSRNAVTLEDWDYDPKRDGIPDEIAAVTALHKPVIGFYGSFAPWLDYEALCTLAKSRPDYQIVMIGYDYEWGKGAFAKSRISEFPNVHIIPAQKYVDLKKFSYWFDVAILPFRIYSLTETVSPVKIFEYMAQKLPVVAAALPECRLYSSVQTFTTPEEFVSEVDRALKLKNDSKHIEALMRDAKANTWEARGRQVLEELLTKVKSTSADGKVQPVLSIGIPLYNMERLIGRCLDSILAPGVIQVPARLEVIVVNDGSKDGSLSCVREYERRYPGVVKVIDKENGGHGSCINAAVDAATGRYFKLIDSDDYVDTIELIRHLRFLESNDVDLVVCDYQQVYVGGRRNVVSYEGRLVSGVSSSEEAFGKLADKYDALSYLHMHAMTYRTEILKRVRITEHSFFVDQEYIVYPLINCRTLAYQPICLYQYQLGRSGQSVDPVAIKKRINQNGAILKKIMAFYDNIDLRHGELRGYIQGVIYNQSWFFLTYADNECDYSYVIDWWRQRASGLKHNYPKIIAFEFGKSPADRDRLRERNNRLKRTVLAKHLRFIKKIVCR